MNAPMQHLDADLAPTCAASGLHPRPAKVALRRQRVALARAMESQIVPRLVAARAPRDTAPAALPGQAGPSQAALDLAALALGADNDAVRRRLLDGAGLMTLETLCLELLEPAARHLGVLWEEDVCSFTDVTIGMMRLHDGLLAISRAQRAGWRTTARSRRILLAPAPGDPHTFGLSMVATFFEQAGWMVDRLPSCGVAELAGALRQDWFGVLGVSVSADRHLDGLKRALELLRTASRNPSLAIIVGGPVFVAHPELAGQVGADGTACDGVQATLVAENLLSTMQSGRPQHT